MNEFSKPPTSLLAASLLLNDLCPAFLFLRSSTNPIGTDFGKPPDCACYQSSYLNRMTDLAI